MRVIARSVLAAFWSRHPETKIPLERWYRLTKAAHWNSTDEVRRAAPKAKACSCLRFPSADRFVKFIGSHGEYDRIDALTVSQF